MKKFKDFLNEKITNSDRHNFHEIAPILAPAIPAASTAASAAVGAGLRAAAPHIARTAASTLIPLGKTIGKWIIQNTPKAINAGKTVLKQTGKGIGKGLDFAGRVAGYGDTIDAIGNVFGGQGQGPDGQDSSDQMEELRRLLDDAETGLKERIRVELKKYNDALIKANNELKKNLDKMVDELTQ